VLMGVVPWGGLLKKDKIKGGNEFSTLSIAANGAKWNNMGSALGDQMFI